jgi:hypothetical protein
MHSHYGMQEQVLMTAPLIVEDDMVRREDRQEIVLMLGRWPFHCHNLYHMQTGMMTEVRYDGIHS